ncbi:MAG: hypothetical protein WA323_00245 [Candidatus Nitrosopolaris sp.]|jgi:hypothetical protein
MMNTKVAHTGMINNNRTNRERINKASATTSETLSAANGTKSRAKSWNSFAPLMPLANSGSMWI